ncbi:hypothetical protein SAMN04489740_0881 [Arthrobacter alpinus]|uniref:Uncharacterized protein n=1 Tax=Arthrobacter alpinus TaxID=656366 RepID=A0A1H5GYV5_9MICC|nr:hypothetical protein [Arthrobacter alpinus]SEE20684.1 hypothetical protein SAMN04489740_0881 [Arthrobacter alpinus]
MGLSEWWVRQTNKLPYVAKVRAFDEIQARPEIEPYSDIIPFLDDDKSVRSTYTHRERSSYVFPSKQSFLKFAEAVDALGSFKPLRIESNGVIPDDEPMAEQVERYFALSEVHRKQLLISSGEDGGRSRLRLIFDQGRQPNFSMPWNTVIDVLIQSSEQHKATAVGTQVYGALVRFADLRPNRGASSKVSVVRPMDIHTRELEEFKTRQTRKTVFISSVISIGAALLTIASRIFLP